ncbi:MAG: dienelactone hydrolase family protein [Spirochaetes bacterium]|nr:dienelactone hydrolase family protein [Spirochaetota bacterium]
MFRKNSRGIVLVFAVAGTLFASALFAAESIDARTLEYTVNGVVCEGYLTRPASVKKVSPAIAIVHQWKGVGDHERSVARRLATLGYIAFAVDVYGKGVRPADSAAAGALAGKYKADRALLRKRVAAGMDALRSTPGVDRNQMVAIGYCFGGTAVLELARSGYDCAGVVSFHGGLDSKNPADAAAITGRVLVLHGGNDPNISQKDLNEFLDELRHTSVDWQFIAYGGAVHSFTDVSAGNDPSKGAAYDERADKRSWRAFMDFLNDVLKK